MPSMNHKTGYLYSFVLALVVLVSMHSFYMPVAAPVISGISGTIMHGSTVTVSGSGFGIKAQAAPIAWDNLESGVCDNIATVGSWTATGTLGINDNHNRNQFSNFNAFRNFDGDISPWGAVNDEAAFRGGTDSRTWYVQYWFYLDSDFEFDGNINNSLGNIKILRMWSTSSASDNFYVQALCRYDTNAVVALVNQGTDWSPVVGGYTWVDEVMGYDKPAYVDNSYFGWKHYENDISTGVWHLFQFEYSDSDISTPNGVFRWWFNGKLIVDKTNVLTRNTTYTSFKRPRIVGFYDSHHATNNDGSNHFYIDDAYIDNTFARVEICSNALWSDKGQSEIQIPVSWSASSIAVNINQGSLADGSTAYLYVIDSAGVSNAVGYPITFGGSLLGHDDTPSPPSGLMVK